MPNRRFIGSWWIVEPESPSLVGLALAGMTLLAVAVTIALVRL